MTGHSDANVILRIEGPPDEKLLRRKVNAGFAVALFLTLILSLLSWRSSQRAAEDADWVAHTHEVSTTLELTLRHLVDVETGARGFALTGQELFLEPYETGKYAASQDLGSLGVLVVDRDQTLRLATLVQQASARIAAAGDLVTSRRNSGRIPTVTQLEHGKQFMDAVRVSVNSMEVAEKQLLEQRTNRTRAAQRLTTFVTWMGSILGMLFLFIAGITINREIDVSAQARVQVNALNNDLERRVAQRTTELQSEIAARMGTEAKLRASEGRLAGIIASAMDAIITIDDEQRIVLFNCAAEKMFRCPEAEAKGRPITRFIPQRFHAAHSEHIQKYSETGVTNRVMGPKEMLWAQREDGQEFRIEASISQVVTGGKKLFTVILRDVTERMRADEIRERLAAVIDSSDDAIISKDLDGNINAWNRGAEKIFGYSASEVLCKPLLMLFPPERMEEESDILSRIRQGESVEHFETVRVRKDGARIDVSVTISPIRGSGGAIVGASKIARDITERKRAEAALRESQTNFAALVNLAPQFVWICTNDGLNVYFNDRWFQYTGLTPEQSHGSGWNTPFHPDDKQTAWDHWNRANATGETYSVESRLRAADGSYRWYLMRGEPVREVDGRILKWFGTCTDIDDMKRAQAALRQSETRFRTLIEQASDAFFLHDSDGRFLEVNLQACESLGYTREELLRMCVFDVEQDIDTRKAQQVE
jgi:PAS domain S-box-containing protein